MLESEKGKRDVYNSVSTQVAALNCSSEKPSCVYILNDNPGVIGDRVIANIRIISSMITRSCFKILKTHLKLL